jgi:hypothetical protein
MPNSRVASKSRNVSAFLSELLNLGNSVEFKVCCRRAGFQAFRCRLIRVAFQICRKDQRELELIESQSSLALHRYWVGVEVVDGT